MKKTTIIAGLLFAGLLAANHVGATTITQWNFNSNPADGSSSTGSTSPSVGTGSVSLIGGTTSTFASGSPSDPAATDNTGYNLTSWAAQSTGSGTAGLQVNASTVGYSNIVLSLDFRQSGTVSRFWQLQVSQDGSTFNNVSGGTASVGTIGSGNTGTSFSSAGLYSDNPGGGSQNFVQALTYTLATGSVYENDATSAFRWVAVFDPSSGTSYISANAGTTSAYSTSGTGRFDMVGVSGTVEVVPEPSSLALAAVGLGALLKFRARKK